MLIATTEMLAQQRGFDYGELLWVLIILVFPVLNSLGHWIRKKWGTSPAETGGNVEEGFDVEVGDDDQLVLRPVKERPSAPQPLPQAKPLRPVAQQRPPARAEIPRARQPEPPRRPARPAPPRPVRREPTPTRTHPAQPARARAPRPEKARPAPAPAPKIDAHRVFASTPDADVEPAADARAMTPLITPDSLTTQGLRKVVILSEILAPPLAIRNNDTSPFSRPG